MRFYKINTAEGPAVSVRPYPEWAIRSFILTADAPPLTLTFFNGRIMAIPRGAHDDLLLTYALNHLQPHLDDDQIKLDVRYVYRRRDLGFKYEREEGELV